MRQAKTWGSWYSWKCCTICSLCSQGRISISMYPSLKCSIYLGVTIPKEGLVSLLLPVEMKCTSFAASCALPILINKFPKKQNILTITAHWQRIWLLGLFAAWNLKSVTSHWIQRWIQHFHGYCNSKYGNLERFYCHSFDIRLLQEDLKGCLMPMLTR